MCIQFYIISFSVYILTLFKFHFLYLNIILQKANVLVAKRGLVVVKEEELETCAQGDGTLLSSVSDKVSDEVLYWYYNTRSVDFIFYM